MNKPKTLRARLSLEKAPKPKKPQAPVEDNKLGLLYKSPTIHKTMRLRVEVCEHLQNIKNGISERLNIKLSDAKIIELLLLKAGSEDIEWTLDLLRKHHTL